MKDEVGTFVWTRREVLADVPSSTTTQRFGFVVNRDRAVMDRGREKPEYLRRVPSQSQGACAQRTPWVCPRFSFGNSIYEGGKTCADSYTCDNGKFGVRCILASDDGLYMCECNRYGNPEEGQDATHPLGFYATHACKNATKAEFIKLVNAGCKWHVWIPLMFDK
jgi:hypothetical protein